MEKRFYKVVTERETEIFEDLQEAADYVYGVGILGLWTFKTIREVSKEEFEKWKNSTKQQ